MDAETRVSRRENDASTLNIETGRCKYGADSLCGDVLNLMADDTIV
jgi:hypothetical protein